MTSDDQKTKIEELTLKMETKLVAEQSEINVLEQLLSKER